MAKILSVGTFSPPYKIRQEETVRLVREIFKDSFPHIDKLLQVFDNGQINSRNFCVPLEWFTREHSLEERNDLYIEFATKYGVEAINNCLRSDPFLQNPMDYNDIDAIFFVSSTGFSTPSIEARIMNKLPFSPHTKRIPIWGLGCAGGASGLSRAYDYCLGYPNAKVLVLNVEFSSLTFQSKDHTKSNLIGTSLFGDGVSCVLLGGEQIEDRSYSRLQSVPSIIGTQSTLFPNTEEIMGWDVKNEGLFVVFSKDIPSLITTLLKPNIEKFLNEYGLQLGDINHFIAHPGGRKVLEAYEQTLSLSNSKTAVSRQILQQFGNMSSATIIYVLKKFLESGQAKGHIGLMTALGPGFSAESLLLKWS